MGAVRVLTAPCQLRARAGGHRARALELRRELDHVRDRRRLDVARAQRIPGAGGLPGPGALRLIDHLRDLAHEWLDDSPGARAGRRVVVPLDLHRGFLEPTAKDLGVLTERGHVVRIGLELVFARGAEHRQVVSAERDHDALTVNERHCSIPFPSRRCAPGTLRSGTPYPTKPLRGTARV